MKKQKVIIIDSGNLMHRSIFAFRNNPQVPPTYTYLRMIISNLKIIKTDIDDLVILACDYGRSWRKGLDKNYKAQRKDFRESKESPQWWNDRYREFDKLFEQLDKATHWQRIALWGWEADDIASVASRYYKDKEIILVSSDKDWEMLAVFPNVKIFSPVSKKYKDIKAPMKVLIEKIQGDISDNLLDKPSSEAEFEKRKKIVDLTQLPQEIEEPVREELDKIMPKNLYIHKIPFNSIRLEIKKLYTQEKNEKED